MRRREFIAALGSAAAWPLLAYAQQDRVRRIGVLMPYTKDDPEDQQRVAAFQEGLKRSGWIEGRNIQSEYRWYAGDADRARSSARELVGLNPDLILVGAAPGLVALRREARAVPLVFVAVTDPVGLGLVESLARPGGNATGFTFFEFSVGTKLLESLQQIAPQVRRIAIMYSPNSPVQNQYLKLIDAIGPSIAMTLIRKPVRDASEIEAAIEAVKPAAEAKDVRVQKIMDTGMVSVPGDPARLQQVVWNLLSNAIKFTPRGGHVQVRMERVNSHLEIVVTDSGQGIAADFLPHVFDRFRQADQRTSRQHGGLGLGLAIVRHLVELHGGSVKAASPGANRGSTFTVVLPLVPLYQVEMAGDRVHPTAAETLPATEYADRLDGLKILVVDDEPDTRELLKTSLGQCGAQVTVAGSTSEAFTALGASIPDVLISDIGMPDEDGYDLIRRLRRMPSASGGKVPAIALTAYARVDDRLRALRAGYQMHVPKPVELAELVAVVASLAERKK